MSKYTLLGTDTINHLGVTLYRVKYKDGTLGGYIESYKNLSQDGNALVYGDARVYGNAWVSGNALVYGDARVYGNAWVSGNALIRYFDEIKDTKNYFSIIGFQYNITVTYSSIHIGRRSYTLDELDTISCKKSNPEYINIEDIPMIKMMIEIALEKILRDI